MSFRLIVVGKTGNGKSSTCNTLAGGQHFEADDCASAVTITCQSEENNAMGLTIVDTPGLCDSEAPLRERALEIQKSVLEICNEPHAFLLVFKMGRITNDDKMTIDLLSIIFGDEVFDHSIVVLTYGCNRCRRTGSTDDELSKGCDEYDERNDNEEEEDTALASFCSKNSILELLVERCSGRVIRIENDVERQCSRHTTKKLFGKLIRYVKSVSNNGKTVFENNFINTHHQTLENETEKYDNLQKEIVNLQRTLIKNLEKARAEERQRTMKEEAERKEREIKEKEEKKKRKEAEIEREKRRREEQEKINREREEREQREREERKEREQREKEEREKREQREREERKEREQREKEEREEREQREKEEREEREQREREEEERNGNKFKKIVTLVSTTIGGVAVGGIGGIAGADMLGKSISVGAAVGGPAGSLVGLGIGAVIVVTAFSRKQKKKLTF